MTAPTVDQQPSGLRGPVPIFAALDVPRDRWDADRDGCHAEVRRRLEQVAGSIIPPYRLAGAPSFTLERPWWDHCRPRPGWVTIYGRALGEPA